MSELRRLHSEIRVTEVDHENKEIAVSAFNSCPYCGCDVTTWRKKDIYRHLKECRSFAEYCVRIWGGEKYNPEEPLTASDTHKGMAEMNYEDTCIW